MSQHSNKNVAKDKGTKSHINSAPVHAHQETGDGHASTETAELYNVTFEPLQVSANERNILCNNLSASIQGKVLLKETTVNFIAGFRYGLLGPNGRGKSSLLRLIEGRKLPCGAALRIQFVEQEQEVNELDTPAVQVVIQSDTRRMDLLCEEAELLQNDDPSDEEHERLMIVQEELASLQAEAAEARARKILWGLGFCADWQDRPTKLFSGGWRKRIALACAVFMEPDFLMLDEPSNHLDLNAVLWLQNYLPKVYNKSSKRPKTLIVVSHDVEFLDSICTHMVHIDEYKLSYYTGGYYEFLGSLAAKRREYDNKFEKQNKEIRSMKKNQHLSKKQIENIFENRARKEGRDLHSIVLKKRREYVVNFPFDDPTPLRDTDCLIKMEGVSFGYPGSSLLYQNVDMAVWSNSRICLVGPNGIGKSTLLNLLDGTLTPLEGTVQLARNCTLGRYNQHFIDKLPMDQTCVEYMYTLGFIHEHEARQRLGSFGLEGVTHHQLISTLSGGQKARVAMASISVQRPHLLMLDEPTNHLDMESITALVETINSFQGGVIVVTHDARLIMDTDMVLWLVTHDGVSQFDGDLEDYREHVLETLQIEEDKRELERDAKKQIRQETVEMNKKTAPVSEPVVTTEKKAKLEALFKKKCKK